MLVFPNAKINLGLHVVEKRNDGFHNIETVFYPVGWSDCLEIITESEEYTEEFSFISSGLNIAGTTADNLVYKAWKLLKLQYKIPALKVHLHKLIPMGAGLGGGSSDASFFLSLINKKCQLNLNEEQLLFYARQLGSDCAFFTVNKPVYATGKGDLFEPLNVDLGKYKLLIVSPGVHSNTREAYSGLTPEKPKYSVKEIVSRYPVKEWKNLLNNDFEKSIFIKYPEIEKLKQRMYDAGAVYASMSGSGSAVFGLFGEKPVFTTQAGEQVWRGDAPPVFCCF